MIWAPVNLYWAYGLRNKRGVNELERKGRRTYYLIVAIHQDACSPIGTCLMIEKVRSMPVVRVLARTPGAEAGEDTFC